MSDMSTAIQAAGRTMGGFAYGGTLGAGGAAPAAPTSRYILPQFEERTAYGFKRQDPYAKLFEDRGVRLDRTYQLNVGGNMDFKNMLERDRLESKKISKTQAVTSNLEGALKDKKEDRNVHIGPSDYVAWLDDRKWAYVRLEGSAFGEVPLNLEYKLEVWDSPNSAGIIIDAIRAAKIAADRGIGGPVFPAAAYLMKSPPVQMEDSAARAQIEEFIVGDAAAE